MTIFDDGPAKGLTLSLSRAPVFLRVTQTPEGFDALDLIEDEPKPAEKLYAYRRIGESTMCFVDGVKDGRRTGWQEIIARYQLVKEQPSDERMRSKTAWQDWCRNAGA
jgi:hypothetical protein